MRTPALNLCGLGCDPFLSKVPSRSIFPAYIVLAISFCLGPLLSPRGAALQAAEAWVQHYNGSANGDDQAGQVATDANGNIFVLGYSVGVGSGFDFVTLKYSSAGTPLWTNRYNGTGNGQDGPIALAIDPSGNVIVAGSSIAPNGFYDYALVKYSNAGVPLWTNRFNGSADTDDTVAAMAIGTDGTIFVTGASARTAVRPYNYPTNFEYATVAFSAVGAPLWTNRYSGSAGNDYPTVMALDLNGNVLVTGSSANPVGTHDFLTVKYSAAGLPLWTNRFHLNASGFDSAKAIATDSNGNVFVSGSADVPNTFYDYATVKYSSAGAPVWTNIYGGPGGGIDEPRAIAVDSQNNLFVTGYSIGVDKSWDFATIKYSNAGMPLWTNRYGLEPNSSDVATALSLDPAGSVWVTGISYTTASADDITTVVYSSDGLPLATNRYSGAPNLNDQANAIVVDREGNAFVAGLSSTTSSGNDFTLLKYSTLTGAAAGPRLSFRHTDGAVVLSWTASDFHLQAAPRLGDAFTNIPGSTTPYTNAFPPAPQLFFRLSSK